MILDVVKYIIDIETTSPITVQIHITYTVSINQLFKRILPCPIFTILPIKQEDVVCSLQKIIKKDQFHVPVGRIGLILPLAFPLFCPYHSINCFNHWACSYNIFFSFIFKICIKRGVLLTLNWFYFKLRIFFFTLSYFLHVNDNLCKKYIC